MRRDDGTTQSFLLVRNRAFRDEDRTFFLRYQETLDQLAGLDEEFTEFARSAAATSAIAHQTVADAGLRGDLRTTAIAAFRKAFALLVEFANSTYEGQRVGLNIALDLDESLADRRAEGDAVTLDTYRAQRWHRLLGASTGTAIVIDAKGTVSEYLDVTTKSNAGSAYPGNYMQLGGWVDAHASTTRSVLALTPSGEILLLHAGTVRYIYRNGSWRSLLLRDFLRPRATVRTLGGLRKPTGEGDLLKQLERAVVSTAIDASLAHHGATIAIVDAERIEAAGLIMEASRWETSSIRRLLPTETPFLHLSPQQRLELLSIDGATVLDRDTGRILAVGAIITRVDSGATGGGRAAATRSLARHGVALKVSQDGAIQVFAASADETSVDQVALVG